MSNCPACPRSDALCRGLIVPRLCELAAEPSNRGEGYRRLLVDMPAENPIVAPARDPERLRLLLRLPRLTVAAGCAELIPEAERRGCDCRQRCLRGRSTRPNGGIFGVDCYECPERPNG